MSLKGVLSSSELHEAIINNNLYKYVEEGRMSIEVYNKMMESCKHAQDDGLTINFDQPTKSNKKKTIIAIIIGIILIACIVCIAFAHSGRTDVNGGHWDRSTGTYHYHNGEYAGQNRSSSSDSTKSQSALERLNKKYGIKSGTTSSETYISGYNDGRGAGYNKGYNEGYAKGYKGGYDKGYQDMKAEHKASNTKMFCFAGLLVVIFCIYKIFLRRE